ncbi:MAG: hypothetical protein RID53_23160 [Coleofasciculus sp. B1-GNL1-01]|uniref:hypothetical protein n=1 Tax=Coleofasciculus sp. B1-GNL1-01 TaxID=3068484 RepID=UPI003302C54A
MRWVAENIFKHTPKQAIAFYPYTENLTNGRSPFSTNTQTYNFLRKSRHNLTQPALLGELLHL